MLVIHSFKSENYVVFYSREAGKKKQFFFHGKVQRSVIRIFMKSIFFNKIWLCLFPAFWWVVCVFFSRKRSRAIHSFHFWSGKKKQTGKKKNSFFNYSFDFSSKNRKNQLFLEKKGIFGTTTFGTTNFHYETLIESNNFRIHGWNMLHTHLYSLSPLSLPPPLPPPPPPPPPPPHHSTPSSSIFSPFANFL